jgi:hypothetical protein
LAVSTSSRVRASSGQFMAFCDSFANAIAKGIFDTSYGNECQITGKVVVGKVVVGNLKIIHVKNLRTQC